MKTILVVDDREDNIRLVRERLSREGYSVLEASDGISGIQAAKEALPDLILLDVMMPGINGLEVCKHLKDEAVTSAIPIIMVTARTAPQDIAAGLAAGAIDYIKKPFDKVELLARVRSALQVAETHRLTLEAEALKTFTATVVTANHKIKQPLTLINLSVTAIRRQLSRQPVAVADVEKKLEMIESAVAEIKNVLQQLNEVDRPLIAQYIPGINMIALTKTSEQQ